MMLKEPGKMPRNFGRGGPILRQLKVGGTSQGDVTVYQNTGSANT